MSKDYKLSPSMCKWTKFDQERINNVAKELNVTFGAASLILFWRTTRKSEWTQEKENYLIKLARHGMPRQFIDWHLPIYLDAIYSGYIPYGEYAIIRCGYNFVKKEEDEFFH